MKMIKNNKKSKIKSGYTILELVFYITFLSIVTFVVINSMIIMAKSFKETSIQAQYVQGGNILERISREIKQAYDINSISASDLVLNTKDSGGANKTLEFLLSSGDVQLIENGTLTGNLNAPNITVTTLSFTQITTTEGKAVKVSLTLKSDDDTSARLINFYDTLVLRGSY